ncbi:MAG: glutamate-1-semialdehyde 2,1-aminomutase [candidate division Zixibacteria bacterium]|nr:glutamate-1-semialdehyde 2,1-aminomutase [candidate division Zixibacteria bacterium]
MADFEYRVSEELVNRAEQVIPGGVNSPVRAFNAVGGKPPVIAKGEGAELIDVDGNRYIDFCCSWGPLILGHAYPQVLDIIIKTASNGTSFGATTAQEVELAEMVVNKVGPLERVRFVSSGTEAVMSAIRVARGFTKRDKIIKFDGCYHGHSDYLLVKAGSGLATLGEPSSSGVPEDFAKHTLIADLNSEDSVAQYFEKYGNEIACVIIEPIPANNGLLLQRKEFLTFLRDITQKHGTLLIFDEVISGFRVGWGGAAESYDIQPDLMTFGKVIGGGMPVGAFGGRSEIMNVLAPLGSVYQAGTLSGNPVAMAAGLETLKVLEVQDAFNKLEELGAHFENELKKQLSGKPLCVVRQGSILWFIRQNNAPASAAEIDSEAINAYNKAHRQILSKGVYLPPSGYEVMFISLVHTKEMLSKAAAIIGEAF